MCSLSTIAMWTLHYYRVTVVINHFLFFKREQQHPTQYIQRKGTEDAFCSQGGMLRGRKEQCSSSWNSCFHAGCWEKLESLISRNAAPFPPGRWTDAEHPSKEGNFHKDADSSAVLPSIED